MPGVCLYALSFDGRLSISQGRTQKSRGKQHDAVPRLPHDASVSQRPRPSSGETENQTANPSDRQFVGFVG